MIRPLDVHQLRLRRDGSDCQGERFWEPGGKDVSWVSARRAGLPVGMRCVRTLELLLPSPRWCRN